MNEYDILTNLYIWVRVSVVPFCSRMGQYGYSFLQADNRPHISVLPYKPILKSVVAPQGAWGASIFSKKRKKIAPLFSPNMIMTKCVKMRSNLMISA